MKRILALITLFLFLVTPLARADIGGSVPAPGGCDYPGIGGGGAAFGEYDYSCAFPTEINGSHWQQLMGGGMWQANLGISIMMFNASVITPVGVLRSITYWACPDLSVAEPPNPPGAWKNAITPTPCKTVAPMPQLIRDPAQPPPGAIAPPPAPVNANGDQPQPAVTNPDNPNPEATQNPAN